MKKKPAPWSTSRNDMDSFTTNPDTGKTEHVVYVYRDPEPRIAIFGKDARTTANLIAHTMNEYLQRQ